MTLIDTAGVYGPYTDEALVGRAVAAAYPRFVPTAVPSTSASPSTRARAAWAPTTSTSTSKTRHISLSEATVDHIKRAQPVHPVTSVQSELSVWAREWRDEAGRARSARSVSDGREHPFRRKRAGLFLRAFGPGALAVEGLPFGHNQHRHTCRHGTVSFPTAVCR